MGGFITSQHLWSSRKIKHTDTSERARENSAECHFFVMPLSELCDKPRSLYSTGLLPLLCFSRKNSLSWILYSSSEMGWTPHTIDVWYYLFITQAASQLFTQWPLFHSKRIYRNKSNADLKNYYTTYLVQHHSESKVHTDNVARGFAEENIQRYK